MRVAEAITLSPDERIILDRWATGRSFPFRVVQRAQIIRMAADGVLSRVIARTLRISRPTVQLWRQRFLALRLPGLEKDAPRPGRIPRISHRKVSAVIHATLHSTPPNATHWSARSLAKAQGLSKDAIHRIWKQYNRKPHLIETFQLLGDCMPRRRQTPGRQNETFPGSRSWQSRQKPSPAVTEQTPPPHWAPVGWLSHSERAREVRRGLRRKRNQAHPNSGNSNKELSAHEFSICSGYFRVCVKHTVPVQPWRRASFWCK